MACLDKKEEYWLFPPSSSMSTSFKTKPSMFMLLTKLMPTPRLLCLPLHLKQTSTPYVKLHHVTSGQPQSTQQSLPGMESSSDRQLGGKSTGSEAPETEES